MQPNVGTELNDNVQLIKTETVSDGKYGRYTGLYFEVDGKELFYALSDSMLYKIILDHQAKCVKLDSQASTYQTP
ncbi:hypothetical protein BH10BAC2_BH10BAC2_12090 [soil metagenome]